MVTSSHTPLDSRLVHAYAYDCSFGLSPLAQARSPLPGPRVHSTEGGAHGRVARLAENRAPPRARRPELLIVARGHGSWVERCRRVWHRGTAFVAAIDALECCIEAHRGVMSSNLPSDETFVLQSVPAAVNHCPHQRSSGGLFVGGLLRDDIMQSRSNALVSDRVPPHDDRLIQRSLSKPFAIGRARRSVVQQLVRRLKRGTARHSSYREHLDGSAERIGTAVRTPGTQRTMDQFARTPASISRGVRRSAQGKVQNGSSVASWR